jgi:hypothetical protein
MSLIRNHPAIHSSNHPWDGSERNAGISGATKMVAFRKTRNFNIQKSNQDTLKLTCLWSLSDLEMGVTAVEFAGSSPPEADLRVIPVFQVP